MRKDKEKRLKELKPGQLFSTVPGGEVLKVDYHDIEEGKTYYTILGDILNTGNYPLPSNIIVY